MYVGCTSIKDKNRAGCAQHGLNSALIPRGRDAEDVYNERPLVVGEVRGHDVHVPATNIRLAPCRPKCAPS
jgi:hypothetical protein